MTDSDSPIAAQGRFYEAFATGDIDAMNALWSDGADVVCIHPGSVALTGAGAIRRSWALILAAETLQIQASIIQQWTADDVTAFTVTEHIYAPERNVRGETLATNAFRLEGGMWRMVLHHGSPKPADAHSTGDAAGIVH